MEQQEIRNLEEIRLSGEESRSVDGYALVFDSLSSDLGGFREKIVPSAIDGVIERSDIRALLNHDSSRGILARSRYGKGTLSLTADEKGLRYQFEAPHTSLGDECIEYLKRGDITQSSFAFTVGEDQWEKQADGSYIRTILSFNRIYDVSPVFEPAYPGTSVACARFAEIQQQEKEENERKLEELRAEEEAKQKEEQQKAEEALKTYYDNLKESYKDLLN